MQPMRARLAPPGRLGSPSRGLLLVGLMAWLPACNATRSSDADSASQQQSGSASESAPSREWPRHAVLFAGDFMRNAISFEDGSYGTALQAGSVVNIDSEIEYGNYEANALSVGIQGRQTGRIVDLGDYRDLESRYGYRELVGGGLGYTSLRLDGERFLIAGKGGPPATQVLREGELLLSSKTRDLDSAQAELGHIYLVRLQDTPEDPRTRLYKLLVTEHIPGQSVVFLWQPLN
jgi:hypothetical protein